MLQPLTSTSHHNQPLGSTEALSWTRSHPSWRSFFLHSATSLTSHLTNPKLTTFTLSLHHTSFRMVTSSPSPRSAPVICSSSTTYLLPSQRGSMQLHFSPLLTQSALQRQN